MQTTWRFFYGTNWSPAANSGQRGPWSYTNTLNGLLKIAEKKYFAEKFENNKSNLKKTWSILKGIINKRKNNKTQEKF